MSIKNKIKFRSDRDRGTSPAVLRSSGPKLRPERVASTLGGEEVSSGRGDLPTDTIRFEEHDEKDYKQKCGAFFKDEPVYVNEDEEYAKHLAKFFKGENK